MVFIDRIILENCRLCHSEPGLYDITNDKKLIKEIYEFVKVKIKDKSMKFLPKKLCEQCKITVHNFSLYQQTVYKVDTCLRKCLKNLESNKEHFECTNCPAEFNNKDSFTRHQSSHVNVLTPEVKDDFNCETCSQKFLTLEEINCHECKHISELQNVEKLQVEAQNDCEYEDNSISFSDKTQQARDDACSKYKCDYKNCNKVLSSQYTLKTHQLKHQETRSFLCVTCGKSFKTKNSLNCHEKIHLDVKGYVCKLCNMGFSVRSNLRAHEKKHHEGIRFYCSQCTKEFSSKCSLERHERIHTGIKDFKCESCPSAFYTRKELLKHQIYHTGLRSHKCDVCFKTFFERHHLVIHLRSHTGERPYVCLYPDCGRSFTESQKLKRHHNARHLHS